MARNVLIVFGTRPEAIKMAPLIKILKNNSDNFTTRVCVTAQHREMLDQVLEFFKIKPDYDLDLMSRNQNLFDLTARILTSLREVIEDFSPDYIVVHGDTTTTMAASLASFYSGSKLYHVEAGLRTQNKYEPFPEEMNRAITGTLADFHFAPTEKAKENLLKENKDPKSIMVTGNTVIDALNSGLKIINSTEFRDEEIEELRSLIVPGSRLILVTGHRRENHGNGFKNICEALKEIASNYPDTTIIYPVHLNPNVKDPVHDMLGEIANIHLIPPLKYPSFIWLMSQAYIILTDSGGIQEEAPSLGKPVLLMRNTTERPEAVEAGTVIMVGTDRDKIIAELSRLLTCPDDYYEMSRKHNPYGDGMASERILNFLLQQK